MKKLIKAVMVTVSLGFTLSWQAVWCEAEHSLATAQNQQQATQPAAPAKADTKGGQSEYKLGSKIRKGYKVNIRPNKVNKGINKGYVILYGHYIKPPYEITFEENIDDYKNGKNHLVGKIFLNGIQIYPPLIDTNIENTVTSDDKLANKIILEFETKIAKLWLEWNGKYGEKKTLDKIEELCKENKNIVGIKRDDNSNHGKIRIKWVFHKDKFPNLWLGIVPPAMVKSEKYSGKELQKKQENEIEGFRLRVKNYRKLLMEDKFIYREFGAERHLDKNDFEIISSIFSDKKSSIKEKKEKLQAQKKFVFTEDEIMILMENWNEE